MDDGSVVSGTSLTVVVRRKESLAWLLEWLELKELLSGWWAVK